MITLDRGLLEGSLHPLHLAIRPGMRRLGKAVRNAMLFTHSIKEMREGIAIPLLIGKLDTIIGEHPMELIGYRRN